MSKRVIVFPGQGSQHQGMGKDLYDKYDSVKKIFEIANANSEFNRDYMNLCFEASDEELKKTVITQPTVYIVSYAIYELLKANNIQAELFAGHSLGEYGALTAAGVISFADGLKLVEKRAYYMDKAASETEGAMAAIIGLDNSKIEEICKNIDGPVKPAAYNSPGQLVISGEKKIVELAAEQCKEAGAKRAVLIPVSGAWHSDLMVSAKDKLAEELNKVQFNTPNTPIISNYSAKIENDVESIKIALVKQLTEPVRWVPSVELMIEQGIDTFIEAGPGKVLSGLIKRIDRKKNLLNVNNCITLEKVLNEINNS